MTSSKKSRGRLRGATADLRFGPGELAGFTGAGVSGFQDLNPAAVVRELLQNSLDAAREAQRPTARVQFEVEEHALRTVPGIAAYRSAFQSAVRDQKERRGELPGQAAVVAEAMEDCLSRPRCTSLFVLDNGIGLNDERMTALLADGLSAKSEAGAGAFGIGHLVVMPASDLRYVLYGGLTEDGRMVGAGHAILASHRADGRTRSANGYFVTGFADDLFHRFRFPHGDAVPGYIRRKLARLTNDWKVNAGTVVAVPGFNRFRGPRSPLWDVVAKAAACSFFPAIAAGELVVEVVENGATRTLDSGNVAATLHQYSEEQRRRKRDPFLSGARAWSAFETIRHGQRIIVTTPVGDIPIYLRETPDSGISRIDLCRNGMWITDEIPKLKRAKFAERRPFHCVLLLDANSGGEIHALVKKAEGPLHNHLEAQKWLSRSDRKTLDDAMRAVAEAIGRNVPEINDDSFRVPDFLALEVSGVETGSRRQRRISAVVPVPPRIPSAGAGQRNGIDDTPWSHGGGERNWRNTRTRPAGRPLRFRALPIPTSKRSCRVDLKMDEASSGSEVRFALDESADESWDQLSGDAYVRLVNVKLDGAPAPEAALVGAHGNGSAIGVAFGAQPEGAACRIEFNFALPEGVTVDEDATVVLKTLVFRDASNAQPEE